MIPYDYHTHSSFSCDCHASMAEMCQGAIDGGLPEIGFTEHYDQHPDDTCHDWFRLEAWAQEIERCRARFAGRLTIRAGIEIGEPHRFAGAAQAILARYPFDYAIGSLHWVGRESVFDLNYFQPRLPEEAFRLYFEELERMTRAGGFDVLGHFDVLARTAYEAYGEYDPRRFEAFIRPALRNCVENGIALDINTAMLRRKRLKDRPPLSLLTPGLDILRWYAELGGERVTLGSDAHYPDHVGRDLELAAEAARAAGLKRLTFFEARRARLEAWL